MVQKRQLVEEEYDASPKHLKMENSCQLVSCLEFPSKESPPKSCISGITEVPFVKETSESESRLESGKIIDHPTCTENYIGYSHLLEFPPLKEIPIGPEYQAVLPEWSGYGSSKTSAFSQISEADSIHHENKFVGSSIIPILESDLTIYNDNSVGKGRTDCCCEDPDSLQCVRQHINEEREKIIRNIGHERFSELGFSNMGDIVASKWTEKDEQLFHEIVYSNPVSLGKNFWVHLGKAFPSRSSKEIVSYYFNVFVLQRRAEQNRCDPMNADSDDDEWQGSDRDDYADDDLCRDEIEKYGFSIGNPVFDYNNENGGDCDFILEPLDFKGWDVGCFSLPRNKNDFLSTGSMIEEVFGVESWNITVKDNEKRSS